MRSNSNENKSDKVAHLNEDDDNLIYLGSMNPEIHHSHLILKLITLFFLFSWSFFLTVHFHDTYIQFSIIDFASEGMKFCYFITK